MTARVDPSPPVPTTGVRARRAPFLANLAAVAGRALRSIPREPEFLLPALFVPLFFFIVNVGSLQDAAEAGGIVDDFKAFQLPVAIVFAVTGLSRANALVVDIQDGYFDRLLMTPIRRATLLLGLMVADIVLFIVLSLLVVGLGLLVGVSFATGVPGVIAFLAYSAAWGLAFTGFPYAIALKTGNPAAVNSSFLLFFPFAFLTSTFLPQEALTGWLATVADYNPVTYLLGAMRSLVIDGWELRPLAEGAAAVAGVAAVSFWLAFTALAGRVSRR